MTALKLVDVDFDAVYKTRAEQMVQFIKSECHHKSVGYCRIAKVSAERTLETTVVATRNIITGRTDFITAVRTLSTGSMWECNLTMMSAKDIAAELANTRRNMRILQDQIDHLKTIEDIMLNYM